MGRKLRFELFRYRPNRQNNAKPYMQGFTIEEEPLMTIYGALNRLREERDPTLLFDFVCRAGICGSCAMLINGKPRLACKTRTQALPDTISLMPLPTFKLIGDLSVDKDAWFRQMNLRTRAWVHPKKFFDPFAEEMRMNDKKAMDIFEAERCIECGCCIAACVTASVREDFIGAAGINRVARFMIDPRDGRTRSQYFDIIGTSAGVFLCMGLIECENYCPQEIPLQKQMALVRREMARMLFSSKKVAS